MCEFCTWLVCSQYLKRGSLTLGITSLYTMCSAIVVSRDKATPTHSITNRPEKCFIPICSVWRETELENYRGKEEKVSGGMERRNGIQRIETNNSDTILQLHVFGHSLSYLSRCKDSIGSFWLVYAKPFLQATLYR